MSLGKEIESFKVEGEINLEKYGEFIQKVARVGKLTK